MKKEAAKMLKKINEVAERSENLESQVSTMFRSVMIIIVIKLTQLFVENMIWRDDVFYYGP